MTLQAGYEVPLIGTADVGGTKTFVAIGEDDISNCEAFDTPDSLDETINTVRLIVGERLGGRALNGMGIAIAGEVDDEQSTIVRAGPLQGRGWLGKAIRQMFADKLNIPFDAAVLINDAESAGLAERDALMDEIRRIIAEQGHFQGFMETVSSGNGGSIFDINGAKNVEPGHIDSGREAPVICGCKKTKCIEAWISGNSVAEAWDNTPMEKVPGDDPRWDTYLDTFFEMQLIKLEELRRRGYEPVIWSLFGSVALKGPRFPINDFKARLATVEPNIRVTKAIHGDKSGLYGAYYATRDMLARAAKISLPTISTF
jgi:predicted NBD/HSP70 family sugar kinase